jgi:pimeloyl-ACP methyl ester carboxylesterase
MTPSEDSGLSRGPDDGLRSQAPDRPSNATRRRLLKAGAAGLVGVLGAGIAGYELVDHGVLPGKVWLDHALGYCTVSQPPLTFVKPGPAYTGSFYSRARRRTVEYMISYPPGHDRGDELPFGVFLHGAGGDYRSGIGDSSLAQVLSARLHGEALPAFALASVSGGGVYWNPHPGDNPQAMVVDELIPICQRQGLGRKPGSIVVTGISMGGYGSLLFAEKFPDLFAATAAISPAVWTSYGQARAANAGAFASAADFANDDVVTHAAALANMPVRIASGNDDPFHPGVVTLSKAVPSNVEVIFGPGCHSNSFFRQQQHPSMEFLGRHLTKA